MDSSYTTGLQHIGVPTKCLKSSIKFYSSLGFEIRFRTNSVAFMELHELCIELYEIKNTSESYGAIDHIALNVKDVEAVYTHVKSLGFKLLESEIQALPFFEKGVRYFTIEGPNAEKIEFNQILS